jgi:hypothetical protein
MEFGHNAITFTRSYEPLDSYPQAGFAAIHTDNYQEFILG